MTLFPSTSYLVRRKAALCHVSARRGVVMYQVPSAINPPFRQQDDTQLQVEQHLSRMEKWLEELNAPSSNKTHTATASSGSDTIHRRRLIYLLETNAAKLRQMNS
ncbi:unnamed protein product [Absidia cylindrospora]